MEHSFVEIYCIKIRCQKSGRNGVTALGCFQVRVPTGLLQDIRLTDADRRVWMIMRKDRNDSAISNVYSPSRLSECAKLARGTIYSSISRLSATGWYDDKDDKPKAIINYNIKLGRWIDMPAELITSKQLQPRDIVVWGLLNDENFYRVVDGKFTYRSLGKYVQACVTTVRRAIGALKNAHWLNTNQKNQMAPIEFVLDSPSARYCREQIRLTKMRLQRRGGHGESIARALVTLVAALTPYWANARPDFLINPETGELMEIDLLLPEHNVGIEFNGSQHYKPTPFASAEVVAKQKQRDAIKIDALIANNIAPVVLTAEDLSVAAVIKKLKGLVPLRDLRLYTQLVNYLNDAGQRYQEEARRLEALQN